jgi:hypothetical protein
VKTAKQNKRLSSKAFTVKRKKKAVIDPNMPDLSKDPYFVEKAERARETLIKYVLPNLPK